ncbi:carbohydrate sulfotransferase 11-like [Nilaparvata lugens]|uniref:carbohydrate sulfotransferase 11-like n=1 Tax=Nilaparvata lugens TaxID=108931 RepID=UPI00193DCD3D|nr:carbohydrate sulfotransferase 11-like [Nilaparvata lugens]
MSARMAARRTHLHAACTRLGLLLPANDTLHRPNPWEFFINRKHHLIWCNVFKAASSSWMYNFNILAGYTPAYLRRTNTVALTLARRRYPRPSLAQLRHALNESLAFLVVRHPFERLLSAYRDKIQGAWPNTPHEKLGQHIVSMYRFATTQQDKKSMKSKKSYNPRWPTFSEFARYLIDVHRKGEVLDMHWTPIIEFCTPCHIEFDIIAKFETLHEDQKYLIDLAGLGHIIKPEWKNPSKGRNTKEVISTYFSQLTIRQMIQLYNIYRFDFEVFDYSLDDYTRMAKLEPSSPTSLP